MKKRGWNWRKNSASSVFICTFSTANSLSTVLRGIFGEEIRKNYGKGFDRSFS